MQRSAHCKLCNVFALDPECWKAHLRGKRHQKALRLEDQKKYPEENGIRVTGFPPTTDQMQLKEFFGKIGPVHRFTFDDQGLFAVVNFHFSRDAEFCLANKLSYGECPLVISRPGVPTTVNTGTPYAPPPTVEMNHLKIMAALSSCEESFQSQLSALLNEIHMADNSKYAMVCKDLEETFSPTYHGCRAYPFGSAVTGLAFKGSDLDVFMDLNAPPPGGRVLIPVSTSSNSVNRAKRLLHRRRQLFSSVFAIPKAKTPIVKFMHIPTETNCDLQFKNALGVNNSALIGFYISMDPRLEPFLLILKYWAKKNDLSGHGKISNYALVMMALFYLQQLQEPIIPTVSELQEGVNNKLMIAGWDCSINTSFSSNTRNTMSTPELLWGFFKFYSKFDCGMMVICPLTGISVPKLMFLAPEQLPEAMHRYKEYVSGSGPDIHGLKVDCGLCVQDPFELAHNVTAGMSLKAVENFKKHCAAAAEVCDEELSTDSEAKCFLKRLFYESVRLLDKSGHITIPFGNYLTSVPSESDSAQKEVSANTEDEMRKRWYKTVLKFVIEIFEDIMKFKVDCEEPEPSRKVQKLEGCSDVSDKMQVLHCSGYSRVWEGRRAAIKKVSIPEDVTDMARERIISDFVVEKHKGHTSTCRPGITFECLFHPEKQPTRVTIQLFDKKSDKGRFKAMVAFLHRRLPFWIEKCLSQHCEQTIKKEM